MAIIIGETVTEVDVAPGAAGGPAAPASGRQEPPAWRRLDELRRQLDQLVADDSRTRAFGNDD